MTGFFASYAEFAKTLRTWFVAYGIGGPVLLLTHDELTEAIVDAGLGTSVVGLFFLGVALQVVAAMIYKICMWYLYLAEMKRGLHKTGRHRICRYISEAFWLELFFDLGTVGSFGSRRSSCGLSARVDRRGSASQTS